MLRDGLLRAGRAMPAGARRALRPIAEKVGVVPPSPVRALAEARRRIAADDLDGADAVLTRFLARGVDDPRVLRALVDVSNRRGEVTRAADLAARLAVADPRPATRHRAALLAGRLRETAAAWEPTLTPSLRAALAAPGPRRGVVYVAKESAPYLANGFCTRTHETLRALAALDVPVVCVTLPGFPGRADAPPTAELDGVVYRHLLPRVAGLDESLPHDEQVQLAASLLAREVARVRPAVLHVASGHRGYDTALASGVVARAAVIPWVYEVRSFFESSWSRDPRYADSAEHHARRLAAEGRALAAADSVVTLSRTMAEELQRAHGIPVDHVAIAPNGVDTDLVAPAPRDAALAARLGLRGTVLGYVGGVSHEREGHELLVDAVALAAARGLDVCALIVGDGSRAGLVRDRARDLGVADRVVMTGAVPRDEVPARTALMDVVVVPRVDERAARLVTPLKPFEAMAAGVPLLMSDLPALVEVAGGGSRAAIFRAGDAASLLDEALGLVDDTVRRDALVAEARRWVTTEHTWHATATALAAVYADLADEAVA